MKKIYSAKIDTDFNADWNGAAYRIDAWDEEPCGEEWDGNVRGYVENQMEGEEAERCRLESGVSVNLNYGALCDFGDPHILFRDGEPSVFYFTREEKRMKEGMNMVKVESNQIAVFSCGDYFVDVCKTRNMDGFMEAWLYHKDGGVKEFMFAVQEEDPERFAALVGANLPGYIRDYESEYMV